MVGTPSLLKSKNYNRETKHNNPIKVIKESKESKSTDLHLNNNYLTVTLYRSKVEFRNHFYSKSNNSEYLI